MNMRWTRRRRRRYIDWDAWEPKPIPQIDWTRRRAGDPLPRMPLWVFADRYGRTALEPEEFAAMPWWERLRWGCTRWDPRDPRKWDELFRR